MAGTACVAPGAPGHVSWHAPQGPRRRAPAPGAAQHSMDSAGISPTPNGAPACSATSPYLLELISQPLGARPPVCQQARQGPRADSSPAGPALYRKLNMTPCVCLQLATRLAGAQQAARCRWAARAACGLGFRRSVRSDAPTRPLPMLQQRSPRRRRPAAARRSRKLCRAAPQRQRQQQHGWRAAAAVGAGGSGSAAAAGAAARRGGTGGGGSLIQPSTHAGQSGSAAHPDGTGLCGPRDPRGHRGGRLLGAGRWALG